MRIQPGRWLVSAAALFLLAAFVGPVVNLGAAVNANVFDSAVTSSTGDAWLQLAIDNTAPYTPLTLAPGQTGTITVTVTPNAAKGTVVHGYVEVETLSNFTPSGVEIVSIPYTYKAARPRPGTEQTRRPPRAGRPALLVGTQGESGDLSMSSAETCPVGPRKR